MTILKKEIDEILRATAEFIKGDSEYDFNGIALGLYHLHSELNPIYRRYATGEVEDWTQIPLMPISEFKTSDVRLTLSGIFPFPGVEFHSSGTTQSDKSKHRMYDTEYYRLSIAQSLNEFVADLKVPDYRVVLLSPHLPNSSLYYMMQYTADLLDYRGVREEFCDFSDYSKVRKLIVSLNEEEHPVLLFGTSLAFYDLIDTVRDFQSHEGIVDYKLPTGSLMIETGGWKGRDIKLDPNELTHSVSTIFGISPSDCLREYSMSELSSQMYSWPGKTGYTCPNHLRYTLVDPLSQKTVKQGESGVIGFYDLANVWSCPFILTEDLGHEEMTYSSSLVLEGRVVDSPEKGCSLSYEEAISDKS